MLAQGKWHPSGTGPQQKSGSHKSAHTDLTAGITQSAPHPPAHRAHVASPGASVHGDTCSIPKAWHPLTLQLGTQTRRRGTNQEVLPPESYINTSSSVAFLQKGEKEGSLILSCAFPRQGGSGKGK